MTICAIFKERRRLCCRGSLILNTHQGLFCYVETWILQGSISMTDGR
jgi:hypothetical protein